MFRPILLCLFCALVSVLLPGCDGKKGQATLAVDWSAPVNAPALQSLRLHAVNWRGREVLVTTLNRLEPAAQTSVPITDVRTGAYYVLAEGYSAPNATGQRLGAGWGAVTVRERTPETLIFTTQLAPNARVTILPDNPILSVGDAQQLYPIVMNPDRTVAIVPGQFTWSTSNPYRLKVSANGLVRAYDEGSELVTASNPSIHLSGTSAVRSRIIYPNTMPPVVNR